MAASQQSLEFSSIMDISLIKLSSDPNESKFLFNTLEPFPVKKSFKLLSKKFFFTNGQFKKSNSIISSNLELIIFLNNLLSSVSLSSLLVFANFNFSASAFR